MTFSLMDDNHVKLIQYFEDQGNKSKQNMLVIVPWIITLTAGIIGFAIKEGLCAYNKNLAFALWFGIGGVIGSGLASFLTLQFGKHIQSNWERSDKVKEWIDFRPDELTKEDYLFLLEKKNECYLPMIAWMLLLITLALFLSSTAVIVLSLRLNS